MLRDNIHYHRISQNFDSWGQRDCTMSNALDLHAANPGLITLYHSI